MDAENNFNGEKKLISESNSGENYGGAVVDDNPRNTVEAREYAEQEAKAEARRITLEEQDKKLLDALDEVLEKRSQREKAERAKRPQTKSERIAAEIANKGVGIVSLALVLIFLGVVMIVTLFSKEPDYFLPLKLSPVAGILVGVEILCNQMIARGRFKVNIPSVIITGLLTVGCCAAGIAMNGAYKKDTIEYNSRTIAAEIYDKTYKELRNCADIRSVEAIVDLNPDGTAVTKGLDALSAGDKIVINMEFGGGFVDPRAFASDCKKIIEGYRIMGINVSDFHFYNESAFNTYTLDVIGKYVQDYSEKRLTEMVNHIYIEDYSFLEDLAELEDEENSGDTSST